MQTTLRKCWERISRNLVYKINPNFMESFVFYLFISFTVRVKKIPTIFSSCLPHAMHSSKSFLSSCSLNCLYLFWRYLHRDLLQTGKQIYGLITRFMDYNQSLKFWALLDTSYLFSAMYKHDTMDDNYYYINNHNNKHWEWLWWRMYKFLSARN